MNVKLMKLQGDDVWSLEFSFTRFESLYIYQAVCTV